MLKRIKRMLCIWIINSFLCGTHFFKLKRKLLNLAAVPTGRGTNVVGPIYLGNVADVSFGDNVWVGMDFRVYGNGAVHIGNNIDIAPEVAFLTGSHELELNPEKKRRAGKGINYRITVEDGCWIGARVTIVGNTTLGSKCVVGACSLVNHSLEPDTVYAGTPAKAIRSC